jgi:hypothetical protein
MPTVDFVTLTVLTLTLWTFLNPAFVDGENLTGSVVGFVFAMKLLAPLWIALDDHDPKDRMPLLWRSVDVLSQRWFPADTKRRCMQLDARPT